MLTALLTFFLVGLVGLLVIGIGLAMIGLVFSAMLGLAGFVLFKLVPILLIGWVIVKLVQRSGSSSSLSAADRRWLDGGND